MIEIFPTMPHTLGFIQSLFVHPNKKLNDKGTSIDQIRSHLLDCGIQHHVDVADGSHQGIALFRNECPMSHVGSINLVVIQLGDKQRKPSALYILSWLPKKGEGDVSRQLSHEKTAREFE